MFLVNFKIVEVFQDIVAFLHCALEKGVDPCYDGGVTGYLMYSLQIPPNVVR